MLASTVPTRGAFLICMGNGWRRTQRTVRVKRPGTPKTLNQVCQANHGATIFISSVPNRPVRPAHPPWQHHPPVAEVPVLVHPGEFQKIGGRYICNR